MSPLGLPPFVYINWAQLRVSFGKGLTGFSLNTTKPKHWAQKNKKNDPIGFFLPLSIDRNPNPTWLQFLQWPAGEDRGGGAIRAVASSCPQNRPRHLCFQWIFVSNNLYFLNSVFFFCIFYGLFYKWELNFFYWKCRFQWKQQYRRKYPDEVLEKANKK